MFVDVHAHLTHEAFSQDLPDVIKKAKENNVLIVCAGSGIVDNQSVLRISRKYGNVYASLGLYPWDAVSLSEGEIDFCIDNIRKNAENIVCIGEIGLDHHWGKGKEDLAKQEWVFNKLLDLSIEINKPVLIHCRKAEQDVLEVLRTFEGKTIIHCYTGPQSLAQEFVDMGCYFSIPAIIVRSKSFKKLVRKVPVNQLLTETDSPFMGLTRERRAEPVDVIEGVKEIAKIKNMSYEKTRDIIFGNFKRMFKVNLK